MLDGTECACLVQVARPSHQLRYSYCRSIVCQYIHDFFPCKKSFLSCRKVNDWHTQYCSEVRCFPDFPIRSHMHGTFCGASRHHRRAHLEINLYGRTNHCTKALSRPFQTPSAPCSQKTSRCVEIRIPKFHVAQFRLRHDFPMTKHTQHAYYV
jgi:hypothetical protein